MAAAGVARVGKATSALGWILLHPVRTPRQKHVSYCFVLSSSTYIAGSLHHSSATGIGYKHRSIAGLVAAPSQSLSKNDSCSNPVVLVIDKLSRNDARCVLQLSWVKLATCYAALALLIKAPHPVTFCPSVHMEVFCTDA